MIDWRLVQPTAASALDFSHYEPLKIRAKESGVKVLPHFINCPLELSAPESTGDIRYPAPAYHQFFGGFVAAGMDYFDEVADVAEIWNEPNLPEFGGVPADVFASLIRASCKSIAYADSAGGFSYGAKRVVSGGLAVRSDPLTGGWRDYLRDFTGPLGDKAFDVGLHSYDFRSFSGVSSDAAADDIAERALANVDDAADLVRDDQKVWLTETGVSAKEPLGRPGQARALAGIADGLRTRPRCGAMIVHRLYPNPEDPDEQPPTSSFHSTAVFDVPYGRPQAAYFRLNSSWRGL
jgi:hypothetical protein